VRSFAAWSVYRSIIVAFFIPLSLPSIKIGPYYVGYYGGPYAYADGPYGYGGGCYIERQVVNNRFGHRVIRRVPVCD
jgi:hypothetical protein